MNVLAVPHGDDPRRFRWVRRGALAGLAGVAIVLGVALIAALPYAGKGGEPYSPLNHWISELGEVNVSVLAPVFNVGLVLAGSSFVAFHVALALATTGRLRLVIAGFGIVSGSAGALVGVFPMNLREIHALVALTFFLTGWIGPALLAVRLVADGRRRTGPGSEPAGSRPGTSPDGLPRWLAIPGVLAAVAFVWFLVELFGSGAASFARPSDRPDFWLAATLEWATLVAILAWTACTGAILVRPSTERRLAATPGSSAA